MTAEPEAAYVLISLAVHGLQKANGRRPAASRVGRISFNMISRISLRLGRNCRPSRRYVALNPAAPAAMPFTAAGAGPSTASDPSNLWTALATAQTHVQEAVVFLHDTTGWSWGATFIGAAVATKLLLLPLSIWGLHNMQRLPVYQAFWAPIRRHTRNLTPPQRWLVALIAARRASRLSRFRVWPIVAIPTVSIAAFVALATSCRQLLDRSNDSLLGPGVSGTVNAFQIGGWGPFADLTTVDTYGLPVVAVMLMMLNFNLATQAPGIAQSNVAKLFQGFLTVFSYMPVFMLPILVAAPQGVCYYIIPSSLCALVQTIALRNQRARAALGLLPLPNRTPNFTSSTTPASASSKAL